MTAAGERPVCGFVGWGPESAALLDALRGTDPERAPHAVALAGAGAPPEVARTVPSVEALFASAQLIVAEGGAAALEPHLATIRLAISDRHVLVLLGSGWSLEPLLTHLHERKLVRCLLLPAQSGTAGSLAFHPTPYFTASELAAFKATFAHLELCVELRDERHFELVQGLADFAPAVFYTVLEAMGDSMVMMGFSRDAAVNLVASLLHGTAQRVLD
ncbi:MAG: hypothetical protein GWO16_14810, partial [Gammaproteobacteria bacterium]|nr:hypothetical protein [Gammaproteobacteria bacterium]NIR99218.1 hypothetical protein [Gammaproteobacteria bacterium]